MHIYVASFAIYHMYMTLLSVDINSILLTIYTLLSTMHSTIENMKICQLIILYVAPIAILVIIATDATLQCDNLLQQCNQLKAKYSQASNDLYHKLLRPHQLPDEQSSFWCLPDINKLQLSTSTYCRSSLL